MGRRLVPFVAVVFLLALVGAGCSAKKKNAGLKSGVTGLGEESLANAGSLEKYQAGVPQAEGESPLKDVHFAFDSFDLGESARQTLQANSDWLRDHPQAKVEIEGHCDERGTVEYNLALGAKRARAVKDYLVTLGTSADRLTTISYGEELPLCREHTEECWQRNRRAHFVVLAE